MADLIKRDRLIDYIMESYPDWCVKPVRPIFDFISDMPSADAVKVVRCKDCKHRCFDNRFGFMCNRDTGDPYEMGRNAYDDDWFCADGERKDE